MAFVRVFQKIPVRLLGKIPQQVSVQWDVRVSVNLDVPVVPSLPFDYYPSALLTSWPLQDFFQSLRNRVEGLRWTDSGVSYELASIFGQLFHFHNIEDMVRFQNHSNEISKEALLNVLMNQIQVGPDDRSRIKNIIKSNYLNNF